MLFIKRSGLPFGLLSLFSFCGASIISFTWMSGGSLGKRVFEFHWQGLAYCLLESGSQIGMHYEVIPNPIAPIIRKSSAMGDLKSSRLIIFKGFLFLFAGIVAAATLLGENFTSRNALLLTIAIWCFCRFYYFAFYVIEKYVDPSFKFSSLWAFAVYMVRRKNNH
jgi:hypothetical protein